MRRTFPSAAGSSEVATGSSADLASSTGAGGSSGLTLNDGIPPPALLALDFLANVTTRRAGGGGPGRDEELGVRERRIVEDCMLTSEGHAYSTIKKMQFWCCAAGREPDRL